MQLEPRASWLGSTEASHLGMTVTASVWRCPEWAAHGRGDDAGQAVPVARVSMPMAAARPLPFPALSLTLSPRQRDRPGKAAFLPALE